MFLFYFMVNHFTVSHSFYGIYMSVSQSFYGGTNAYFTWHGVKVSPFVKEYHLLYHGLQMHFSIA